MKFPSGLVPGASDSPLYGLIIIKVSTIQTDFEQERSTSGTAENELKHL